MVTRWQLWVAPGPVLRQRGLVPAPLHRRQRDVSVLGQMDGVVQVPLPALAELGGVALADVGNDERCRCGRAGTGSRASCPAPASGRSSRRAPSSGLRAHVDLAPHKVPRSTSSHLTSSGTRSGRVPTSRFSRREKARRQSSCSAGDPAAHRSAGSTPSAASSKWRLIVLLGSASAEVFPCRRGSSHEMDATDRRQRSPLDRADHHAADEVPLMCGLI